MFVSVAEVVGANTGQDVKRQHKKGQHVMKRMPHREPTVVVVANCAEVGGQRPTRRQVKDSSQQEWRVWRVVLPMYSGTVTHG